MSNVYPVSNRIIIEYKNIGGEIAYTSLYRQDDLQLTFRVGHKGEMYVRVADAHVFHRLMQLQMDAGGTAIFCVSDDPATDEQLGVPAMTTYQIMRVDGSSETMRGFDKLDVIRASEGGSSNADIESVERID